MKIALLEPFLTGSHAVWAEEYAARSRHRIKVFGLPGRYWKWRMHGGAVSLAREFLASDFRPDLLLATDMLDLAVFLALTRRRTAALPVAVYFHENQLTYPWSPADPDVSHQRDGHYAFINYTSALAADAVLFNSDYHRHSFLEQLPQFLKTFPDLNETQSVDRVREKSRTLPLGLDLRRFDAYREKSSAADNRSPLLLWNHRWEYDKHPEAFFNTLFRLQDEGLAFELAVLGESYRRRPEIFAIARTRLKERIVHWGYVESFAEYARWLWRADILPVTAIHDFFGASVVQALYCACRPLLPQRLAYPEHIPADYHRDCFYADEQNLYSRLRESCLQEKQPLPMPVRDWVLRYDWSEMARVYDRELQCVVLESSGE
jgi:glycosyltransferase involved in cell wall biosynthesis